MSTTKIQFRRKVIVIVLLCVAVGGAVVRHYATPGTTTRDIATLLMVLWVPIIGNVIAWLISKRPRRAPSAPAVMPPSFDTAGAFTPHARVELTFRKPALPSQDVPIAPGEYRCALVIDKEGFSARWVVPPGDALERGKPAALEVEFLSPAVAQPKFAQGAVFRVLIGDSFIADGRVL
ncbi:hypothetical protein SAMN05518669_101518 [Variovorax sp. YR634]|jgi:hypothetical protein|uniref:hypothetical protein n=1 Tax=Variovorax TaxID=34072 RepID=UPI0008981EA4|nr:MULTISPECIES: hypothetical protein [Variovorax]MDQ0079752.1 hypothetical protein [Variovorax boronicumulans]SDW36430.1 hypothetical protein SAMN05518669_101518 [Variovorax sp. YR634]SDY12844.1 hypothetical protein SAMN05518854_101281 [Variovorax sp. YR266]